MMKRRISLALAAALSVSATSCAVTSPERTSIMDNNVTDRDIEIARQLGAPQNVVDDLEHNDWGTPNVHSMVRNAEDAIDHMAEARGIACEAVSSEAEAFGNDSISVVVRAIEGKFAGSELHVEKTGSGEKAVWLDDLYRLERGEEFFTVCQEAASDVIAGIASGSSLFSASLSDIPANLPQDLSCPLSDANEHQVGSATIYLAPSAGLSEDELIALTDSFAEAASGIGAQMRINVLVLSEGPAEETPITEEFIEEMKTSHTTGKLYAWEGSLIVNGGE